MSRPISPEGKEKNSLILIINMLDHVCLKLNSSQRVKKRDTFHWVSLRAENLLARTVNSSLVDWQVFRTKWLGMVPKMPKLKRVQKCSDGSSLVKYRTLQILNGGTARELQGKSHRLDHSVHILQQSQYYSQHRQKCSLVLVTQCCCQMQERQKAIVIIKTIFYGL